MHRDISMLHEPKYYHGRPDFSMRRRLHEQEDVGDIWESKIKSSQGKPVSDTKSRRSFLKQVIGSVGVVSVLSPLSVLAEESENPEIPLAQQKSLESSIYTILRVREATSQETRLISTGKFKDVQRANVKLAVKFMLQNYRLSDNFITASSYLESPSRRIEAGDIGQQAVQSLYTILEYFDSSDVQNIQVSNFFDLFQNYVTVKRMLEFFSFSTHFQFWISLCICRLTARVCQVKNH